MTTAETAVDLFRNGCACSQAVLGAFAPRYGLEPDLAVRLACCFAGGMRRAETCGAVTGALMVLGLAFGTEECRTGEGRAPAFAAAAAFSDAFRQRHGALECRNLLSCDISTEGGAAMAREHDLFNTQCPQFVHDAADILEAMLPKR